MNDHIQNGIHTGLSIEDYHAERGHYSATALKYARKSLKDFRWYLDGKIAPPKGAHFGMGNAFEIALIDRHQWKDRVAIAEEDMWVAEVQADARNAGREPFTKPKGSAAFKKLKKEFEAENKGKNIINNVDGSNSYEAIEEMLSSCFQDKTINALIQNVESNISCFWTDPETKLNLKTRPDITQRKKNLIINVKTIEDGSPAGFSRDLAKYSYPFQAAIEIRGVVATGVMETVDNYFWIVVEKNPPYNATVYEFEDLDRKRESDRLDFVLHQIEMATAKDVWPGYSNNAENKHGILRAPIPVYYWDK